MTESGVLDKTALVFGQMNEPPGARLRVGLTGLTMAEYFRDVAGQDVLLFIDNIFRFIQAGSEVSALMGRMPSAVGYQPTLANEVGLCRRGSHQPRRVPSHRFRLSTFPQMTILIRPLHYLCPLGCHDQPGAKHCRAWYLSGCRPPSIDVPGNGSPIRGEEHYQVAR